MLVLFYHTSDAQYHMHCKLDLMLAGDCESRCSIAPLRSAGASSTDRIRKPTLLIVSFPAQCHGTFSHMPHASRHAGPSPFALDRALLKACAQFVWLLVCLVLFVCVLARSGLLAFLVAPRPLSHCVLYSQMHLGHLNCLCRWDLQPRPRPQQASLLWTLV